MWPDLVSSSGPLGHDSDALPTPSDPIVQRFCISFMNVILILNIAKICCV